MNKVKVGVIGCGSIARFRHLPEYQTHPDVVIAAVCDVDLERAEAVAQTYGTKAYTNYIDLLNDEEINAVSICTPNVFHAPMSIAALEAGKHVLCEKPMATTIAEAERMNEAAKESGKILMIGHMYGLYHPIKKLVGAGGSMRHAGSVSFGSLATIAVNCRCASTLRS